LHHVRIAGGRAEALFTDEALEVLARGSGGVPRLMNQVGRQALTLAAEGESSQVDAEAALEALTRLGIDASASPAGDDKSGAADEGVDPSCRLFVSLRPA
jgi:Holliday junction resolvasome RuvABC ATP-dependent DNA helicase subunit